MKKIISICLLLIFAVSCSNGLDIKPNDITIEPIISNINYYEESIDDSFVGTGYLRNNEIIDYTYYSIDLASPKEDIKEVTKEKLKVNNIDVEFLLYDPVIYDLNNDELDKKICDLYKKRVISDLSSKLIDHTDLLIKETFKDVTANRTFYEINGYLFLKTTYLIRNYKEDNYNDAINDLKELLTLTDIDFLYNKLGLIKNIAPNQIYDYFMEYESGIISKAEKAKELIRELNKYNSYDICQLESMFIYYDLYDEKELQLSDLFFLDEDIYKILYNICNINEETKINKSGLGFDAHRYRATMYLYDDLYKTEKSIEIDLREFFDNTVVGYKRSNSVANLKIDYGEWFIEKQSNLNILINSKKIEEKTIEDKVINVYGVDLVPMNEKSSIYCENLEDNINAYILSIVNDLEFYDLIMYKNEYEKLEGTFDENISFGVNIDEMKQDIENWRIINNWVQVLPIYVDDYKLIDYFFESISACEYNGINYLKSDVNIDDYLNRVY